MKKIRLEVDELRVESFDVTAEEDGRTTVHGHVQVRGSDDCPAGVDSGNTPICGHSWCGYYNTCSPSCGSDPCVCDVIDP